MSENVTDFEQKINNINVCLKTGNVAAEDADCIVVPEFRDGASGGGVGYAIETAGMGAGLEAYGKVAQEGFLKDGDAIITESGKPDVKLAHVVTVSAREDSQFEVVNRSVLKTLETANEVGIKRIALPEIGTGIIGSLTQEQSAKAIFNAVYEFSKNNPSSSVEEVSFVVYRSSTEPAKRVLTDKSYIGIMTEEKGNKSLDLEEFVEGLGNHGVRKKAKSPTREEILQDPEARKITGFKMTKLFFAETPEAVDAYIEAGVDINHQDISKETALDWTINRIVRDINTYEDSDNKGAVLQMSLKGGKCSEESLEQLKDKDPEFCSKVIEVMKGREKLQDLSTKTVTDTQYPVSGHTDENEEKIVEALGRLAGKIASKGDKPRSSSGRDIYSYPPDYDFRREEMMKKLRENMPKKKREKEIPLQINQPKNLTLLTGDKHVPLHGLDNAETLHIHLNRETLDAPSETLAHELRHAKNKLQGKIRVDIPIAGGKDRQSFTWNEGEAPEAVATRIKRRQLLDKAAYVGKVGPEKRVEDICAAMVKVANEPMLGSSTGKASKGSYMGYEFVVDKGAKMEDALFAWKEQALMPRLLKQIEEKPEYYPEEYAHRLESYDDKTKIDSSADSYYDAAMAEILVTKYPEYADKLTMLQLLNALSKTEYKTDISEKLLAELNKSAEKFAKGAETFPPTLENIVTLNKQREELDSLLSGKFGYDAYEGGTLKADFEKRVGEVELKMLRELKPENLQFVSDNQLAEGIKIAARHKDAGDFEKMFTNELIKNRLAKGKIFDPRDPK